MNANAPKEKRVGVMVHYSAGSYASTCDWCRQPKSGVSYNEVIGPKGEVDVIVPDTLRAWHAGVCRSSDPKRLPYRDANSAFYGIALSGGPPTLPTARQKEVLVQQIRAAFDRFGWDRSETWRIVGHDTEAWPRGRKQDPTGPDKARPWLSLAAIREEVAR